jgi:uncharacterized protein YodC (DUF2158 family)
MPDEIQPGDVVSLKGHCTPLMTVESVNDGKAQCVWFVGCELHRDSFAVAALTKN